MTRLIDISHDLIELEEQLEQLAEFPLEQEQAIAQWLQNLEGAIAQRDRKLDNYAGLIQELQARAEARRAEAERLRKRSQVDEYKARVLKHQLIQFFQAHKLKTVETVRFRLTLAQNGGKAPMILDDVPVAEIPDAFTYREPDREAIRKALEAGEVLKFARLGDRGQSLRIK